MMIGGRCNTNQRTTKCQMRMQQNQLLTFLDLLAAVLFSFILTVELQFTICIQGSKIPLYTFHVGSF